MGISKYTIILEFLTAILSFAQILFHKKKKQQHSVSQNNISSIQSSEVHGNININQINNNSTNNQDWDKKNSQQQTITQIGLIILLILCYVALQQDHRINTNLLSFSQIDTILLLFNQCCTIYLVFLIPTFVFYIHPFKRKIVSDIPVTTLIRKVTGVFWICIPFVMLYVYFFMNSFPTKNFLILLISTISSYQMITLFLPIVSLNMVYFIELQNANILRHLLAWLPPLLILFFNYKF